MGAARGPLCDQGPAAGGLFARQVRPAAGGVFVLVVEARAACSVAAASAELEAAVPTRGRIELSPALVVLAEFIVGRAFLGIAQGLVGFGDFLEACLGVGLLAHVGVVLAGQLPIGLLD